MRMHPGSVCVVVIIQWLSAGCRFDLPLVPDAHDVAAACGDGVVVINEQCDPGSGGELANCDSDCTFVQCGDGHVNPSAGEECDSSGVSTSECAAPLCKLSRCGDLFLNTAAGETCDSGGDTSTCNGSNNQNGVGNCQIPACGDGYRNASFVRPVGRADQKHAIKVATLPRVMGVIISVVVAIARFHDVEMAM